MRPAYRLIALSLLAAVACRSDIQSPITPPLDLRLTAHLGIQHRTAADGYRDLSRTVPRFASVFIDTVTGGLVINATADDLTDPERSAILGHVRAVTGGAVSPLRANVRRVPFAYAALDSAYRTLLAEVGSRPYITATRIDDFDARIVISVDHASSAQAIRRAAVQVGIPVPMVGVEIRPRAVNAATLDDRVRPVYGGLHVRAPSAGSHCSLGFNGFDSQGPVFMTAAHCTNTYGTVTGTQWFQGPAGADFIGTEIHQAPVYPKFSPECPFTLNACTYADEMVGRYSAGVQQGYGLVYRTQIKKLPPWNLTIVGSYAVNGQLYGAVAGELVYKTGQTTGTTGGYVQSTCVNVPRTGTPDLICVHSANYAADAGDSGGPVFIPFNSSQPNSTPRTVGIYTASAGSTKYYSPIGNIFNAQGFQFNW